MKTLIQDDGFIPCTGITDDDIMREAQIALAKVPPGLKALKNKFIAWIAPFRKEGVIEVPWDFQQNSCEAVMVSDGTGAGVPAGTLIMVRPDEGILHTVNGVELCFLPQTALMLAQLA